MDSDTVTSQSNDLQAASATVRRTQLLRDYLSLTKPEISFLVTVSALGGFLLGSPTGLDGWTLLATLVGVALCSGGAGALNHYLEADIDGRMRRTQDRPLPAGRLSESSARNFGAVLILAGVGLLCPTVNPLTSILAALTVVLYLFVYTPLKLETKHNTLIGTLPGALPVLGGYAAATNSLGPAGWTLFAVLVTWQMPHFLSLAWMYRKDYARGNYAMLPVLEPTGDSTARQTVLFTALLLLASITLVFTEAIGLLYLAGALPLGLWFLYEALRFYRERTGLRARAVLKASIYYIPLLVGLIALDWAL